eukprot:m.149463 g.149463  ORF g.149463 m.149463 type:complete len:333 (-) comp23250_c0_seq1:2397-3395(-)
MYGAHGGSVHLNTHAHFLATGWQGIRRGLTRGRRRREPPNQHVSSSQRPLAARVWIRDCVSRPWNFAEARLEPVAKLERRDVTELVRPRPHDLDLTCLRADQRGGGIAGVGAAVCISSRSNAFCGDFPFTNSLPHVHHHPLLLHKEFSRRCQFRLRWEPSSQQDADIPLFVRLWDEELLHKQLTPVHQEMLKRGLHRLPKGANGARSGALDHVSHPCPSGVDQVVGQELQHDFTRDGLPREHGLACDNARLVVVGWPQDRHAHFVRHESPPVTCVNPSEPVEISCGEGHGVILELVATGLHKDKHVDRSVQSFRGSSSELADGALSRNDNVR